jgi:hypothetical protein
MDSAVGYLTAAARMLHTSGLLLTLPDAISLLGGALLRSGRTADAARMLAAGAAWRAERALIVVNRAIAQAITDAETQLIDVRRTAAPAAGTAIDQEAARGAATPFGVIETLDLPAGEPGARVQIHLVDLSRSASGAATAPS